MADTDEYDDFEEEEETLGEVSCFFHCLFKLNLQDFDFYYHLISTYV